jgi:hypothetical protein
MKIKVSMKAILEFNLPEEQDDFNHVMKTEDYYNVIFNFDKYLRREVKYNESLSKKEKDIILKVRDTFSEILTNNEIQL